jgi:oligopeptidase B
VIQPPIALRKPVELTQHGETRIDEYYWLRERENPGVTAYLEAENAYTEEVMQPAKPLQEKIYQEILGRIQQTDLDVPVKRGDYFYYSRTIEGKQYPVFCRKYRSLDTEEHTILDANQLAEGKQYFALGALAVSEDHRLLGYSVDNDGAEEFTVFVKDLSTGATLPERIEKTSAGFTWANDNRTFFYTTFDQTKRPEKVWRHVLGTDRSADALVFEEPDTRFTFEVHRTRSRKYILITSINASTTSEVWYADADSPEQPFQLFRPRRDGVEYYLDHQSDAFLIRTNENGAINFKLLQGTQEIWPARADATLEDTDCFESFLVLYTREKGLPQIHVLSAAGHYTIDFPEPAYTVSPVGNAEFQTTTLRFSYASQVTPQSIYDFDMVTKDRVLKKRAPVLGGYDPNEYTAERIQAKAPDGTEVPISLVYKKGFQRDGTRPALLNGYGSYGINYDPSFSYSSFSLIDRGFVVAIAHVRGGSEHGRTWFESGRLLHKQNSFTDFIACGEHLIKQGYCAPNQLTAMGGSAGGLLMGAVINMRPDLFRSVVANVPFVDVVTTMLDPTIPLTTGEYDQWGHPEEKQYYDYMKSYSPYDNVEAKDYPNLLVTTGLNDPRVAYWEPAKWVARLRAWKTDHNLLLLKTEMGAGHGGPSGRYARYRETAFFYAFLLFSLGLPEPPPSPMT